VFGEHLPLKKAGFDLTAQITDIVPVFYCKQQVKQPFFIACAAGKQVNMVAPTEPKQN
jgi:hypothetical protein